MKEYLVTKIVKLYYSVDAQDDCEAVDKVNEMSWDENEDYDEISTEVTLIDDGEYEYEYE